MIENPMLFVAMLEFTDRGESYLQTFWAYGESLGEAKFRIETSLADSFNGEGCICEMDPYDGEPPFDEKSPDGKVLWSSTRYYFPKEYSYRLPTGVLKSCVDGEYTLGQIVPGYAIRKERTSFILEAVVHKEDLFPMYEGILDLFKEFRAVMVKVDGEWERFGRTEMFANENLSSPAILKAFLENHEKELIQNGHVTLIAYLENGRTNIQLTDHKTVRILSLKEDVVLEVGDFLESMNIPKSENLFQIEYGFHHWHYVGCGISRAGLIDSLLEEGFHAWQPKSVSD
jgi:hypothetical protein